MMYFKLGSYSSVCDFTDGLSQLQKLHVVRRASDAFIKYQQNTAEYAFSSLKHC